MGAVPRAPFIIRGVRVLASLSAWITIGPPGCCCCTGAALWPQRGSLSKVRRRFFRSHHNNQPRFRSSFEYFVLDCAPPPSAIEFALPPIGRSGGDGGGAQLQSGTHLSGVLQCSVGLGRPSCAIRNLCVRIVAKDQKMKE
jgi:hypothetical protein